jgi:hypothetical protein
MSEDAEFREPLVLRFSKNKRGARMDDAAHNE